MQPLPLCPAVELVHVAECVEAVRILSAVKIINQ